MKRNHAASAKLAEQTSTALALLAKINNAISAERRVALASEATWQHVGSMGHVVEQLIQLDNFFNGK